MVFAEFDEYDKIWMSYMMQRRQALKPRSGICLAHLCTTPGGVIDRRFWKIDKKRLKQLPWSKRELLAMLERPETVLEHSACLVRLISDLASWFPDYIPEPEKTKKLAGAHDIGEIYIGDIADDGSPEHAKKEDQEQATFLEWLYTQPEAEWEDLYQYYLEFQDHSTLRGQILYLADKMEAVLGLLLYESYGLYGDVTKKRPPSEQDLEFAKIIGTTNATDVWAYHFKTMVDQHPSEVSLPLLGVLDSAVRYVRGEWFPWWTFWQNHPRKFETAQVA